MRRAFLFAFALSFAASFAASGCKDDDERPPVSGDNGATFGGSATGGASEAGASDGGALDAGDSGLACNTLVNDGNVVDQNRIVGDPPTGTGGTIVDGTWELSAANLYVGAAGTPGPSGVTYRGVLRLTSGKLERVTEMTPNQGSQPIETRSLGDLVAGGSTFTVTQSCPAPFQDQYTYSVVNNALTITSLVTKESFTFTLR